MKRPSPKYHGGNSYQRRKWLRETSRLTLKWCALRAKERDDRQRQTDEIIARLEAILGP